MNKNKQFEKEILDYYSAKVNSDVVKGVVQYYDLRKENKLEKMQMDTTDENINPVLKFNEHDFNKVLEEIVDVLDEHFDGIEISNKMSLNQQIDVLRHFDEFDRKLSEKDEPQVDDLLDLHLTDEDIAKFKDKNRYLPHKTLSYREYLAIYKSYQAVDFERSSFLTAGLP
jgi:hypothetical protein